MFIHICLKGSWNNELIKSQRQIDQLREQFQAYKDKEHERNQFYQQRSGGDSEEQKEEMKERERIMNVRVLMRRHNQRRSLSEVEEVEIGVNKNEYQNWEQLRINSSQGKFFSSFAD